MIFTIIHGGILGRLCWLFYIVLVCCWGGPCLLSFLFGLVLVLWWWCVLLCWFWRFLWWGWFCCCRGWVCCGFWVFCSFCIGFWSGCCWFLCGGLGLRVVGCSYVLDMLYRWICWILCIVGYVGSLDMLDLVYRGARSRMGVYVLSHKNWFNILVALGVFCFGYFVS